MNLRPGLLSWLALACSACVSTPGASILPSVVDAPAAFSISSSRIDAALADSSALIVEPRAYEGVKGAELDAVLPGTPEEVLDALQDFEHMDGRRSIAERFELLERDGDRTISRWHFKRYKIVRPTVSMEHTATRQVAGTGAIEMRYRVVEPDFGVAALFGSRLLVPITPDARGGRTFMNWTNHVDTGLPLLSVDADDLAEAMRTDVEELRGWLLERLTRP